MRFWLREEQIIFVCPFCRQVHINLPRYFELFTKLLKRTSLKTSCYIASSLRHSFRCDS